MVLNIAHRGGADLWPENTLPAFEGAIACGADGAELDVHLSSDGELIVFHDETLKPEIVRKDGAWITGRTPLKNLTAAELAGYDAGTLQPGTSYARRHPGQARLDGVPIPRLTDVITLAKARSDTFQLWIELKTDLLHLENGADPVTLAEAATALVEQLDFTSRTVFVSFDWRALARVRALNPHIPFYATTLPQSWFGTAYPPPEHGPPLPPELAIWRAANEAGAPWEAGFHTRDHGSLQAAIAALGATGWFPFWRDITPLTATAARDAGLKLAAWTAPVIEAENLANLGCHAICCDDPVALRNIVSTVRSKTDI
ncbi:MAG: glycerophosphodiester phosphodiesterase family protein [Micropepsaceae bacterium]